MAVLFASAVSRLVSPHPGVYAYAYTYSEPKVAGRLVCPSKPETMLPKSWVKVDAIEFAAAATTAAKTIEIEVDADRHVVAAGHACVHVRGPQARPQRLRQHMVAACRQANGG